MLSMFLVVEVIFNRSLGTCNHNLLLSGLYTMLQCNEMEFLEAAPGAVVRPINSLVEFVTKTM